MYHQFNIQQFYILPTQCIYVFCVYLRTNTNYFPLQHNCLVCITTHIHSVSHAVQNNSVIIIQVYLAQSAICVPPIAEASVQSQTSPCEICGRQTGTGSGHSPSTALSPLIILPALHTYLHLLAVLAKTNGCSLTTFYTTMLFQKSGSTG